MTSTCGTEMGGHWQLFGYGLPDTRTQALPALSSPTKGWNWFTTVARGIAESGSGGKTTVTMTINALGMYRRYPATQSDLKVCLSRDVNHTCDGIETSQEWMFRDQEHDDILTYDCRHTIRNYRGVDLVEYAQFFACYTEVNRDRSGFYWSKDGTFKSFQSVGGHHLDAYIVAPGAGFERRGVIPHAFRGGGRVADTWHHPVLVGQPTPKGSRHIVFTEPTTTAGLASGMGGIAMDYIAYPGCDIFKAGEVFSIRVRHHIVRMPGGIDITLIEQLWGVWVNGLMG